jgi:hypothetical protein
MVFAQAHRLDAVPTAADLAIQQKLLAVGSSQEPLQHLADSL